MDERRIAMLILLNRAPVAQLDRASGYEPEGREFESPRARHFIERIVFNGFRAYTLVPFEIQITLCTHRTPIVCVHSFGKSVYQD